MALLMLGGRLMFSELACSGPEGALRPPILDLKASVTRPDVLRASPIANCRLMFSEPASYILRMPMLYRSYAKAASKVVACDFDTTLPYKF